MTTCALRSGILRITLTASLSMGFERYSPFSSTHCAAENPLDTAFINRPYSSEKKSQIVGLGTACLDYVVTLPSFPKPDEKVRVMSAEQHGGGNIANTMSCISRLNLCDSEIVTKLGQDSMGDYLEKELVSENVNVDSIVRDAKIRTPFTYVIVNKFPENTRTCIHTPMEQELSLAEISPKQIKDDILFAKTHLHLDSRQTEMAYRFASICSEKNIPVSMDCEKDRPGMNAVLPYCHILFTNEKYPALYRKQNEKGDFHKEKISNQDPEEKQIEETLANVAFMMEDLHNKRQQNGKPQFVVTCLGSYGSILFLCPTDIPEKREESSLRKTSIENKILLSSLKENPLSTKRFTFESLTSGKQYQCVFCPALRLSEEEIVDTTGAGDSYIGAFLSAYYDNSGQIESFDQCMQIATYVAARKIGYPGARTGLPTIKQLTSFISMRK